MIAEKEEDNDVHIDEKEKDNDVHIDEKKDNNVVEPDVLRLVLLEPVVIA